MIPESIAAEFKVDGHVEAVLGITTGNVNDTYRVIKRTASSETQFILQRISPLVFPRPELVMANLKAVTDYAFAHIEEKQALADRIWQLPRVISARDGRNFIIDENGHYWRALSLITGASSHERVLSADHAHEAGCVLGHFQSLIADFPIAQLEDTLPGFHITPGYLQSYDRTVAKVEARRKLDASGEARRIDHFIQDRRDFAHVLERARERGELVLRPIHGDPKISNIMIDDHTGQGIAIIDLDTVKPGLIHYDFGDCVRSVCNPAGEEVRDLDAVDIDIDYFKALVSGYLKSTRELLSDADRHYLYDAVRLIAFELGLRFFTDYLLGDVYFKTTYPEQNLNRARVQLRLCKSIETSERMMRNVLEEI